MYRIGILFFIAIIIGCGNKQKQQNEFAPSHISEKKYPATDYIGDFFDVKMEKFHLGMPRDSFNLLSLRQGKDSILIGNYMFSYKGRFQNDTLFAFDLVHPYISVIESPKVKPSKEHPFYPDGRDKKLFFSMLDYLESHRGPADKYLTNGIKISRDSCMTAVWNFGKYRIEMRSDREDNDIYEIIGDIEITNAPVFRNEVTQIGVQGFIPIASSSFVTSSSYSVRSMTDIFFPLYGFTYSILYRLSARNFAR